MRKFFLLVVLSLLGVILYTGSFSSTMALSPQNPDYAQKIWQSHANDSPIATPMVTQQSGTRSVPQPTVPVQVESVTYGTMNKKPLKGYLARPSQTNKDLPALIVIHEWWGLNDNIKMMTQRLAGEGYTALAVDLYGGQVADNPATAAQLVTEAQKNPKLLKDNLRSAYQYLEQNQKASKIASIGWCFGGTWSFNTALLFPTELDAAVIYYGGGIETNPNVLKPLQIPILGIFGGLDQNPPVTKVREFEKTLQSLGKPVEIYVYEDADHAFANPSGTRYNEAAARDAWQKTRAFLQKYLQN
ncbi:dienelactone hydrolase family protein [Gloeothece verrucosa]|uniref:Carboxymethylenebutenolidase n=1 Tax=Gloeothece verrucosa (strain PCC 7822) TaxID=497965 RepID=E0U958_GLOV7|nr:dienelactone hydrolase family protein [Gloeothece verrucosa]ADN17316.1 Carboxymethylenebutenolidase [Gloeothece verrucosa PCC 7822]